MSRQFYVQSAREQTGDASPRALHRPHHAGDPSEFELGAGLLTLFVCLAPLAIVGGIVIGYLAFVH